MREPRDTERGERVRACRAHGPSWRPEGRSAALPWRLPAEVVPEASGGRAERIALLRAAVEAGAYDPDPLLVAGALILAGAV